MPRPVRCRPQAAAVVLVDPDWVVPQVMRLVPNGGRVDQEVRRLDNTYLDLRPWIAKTTTSAFSDAAISSVQRMYVAALSQ